MGTWDLGWVRRTWDSLYNLYLYILLGFDLRTCGHGTWGKKVITLFCLDISVQAAHDADASAVAN